MARAGLIACALSSTLVFADAAPRPQLKFDFKNGCAHAGSEVCRLVRGRLSLSNTTPPMRLSAASSKQVFGVSPAAAELIPEVVRQRLAPGIQLYGDFSVCPMTRDKSGEVQSVCLDSGTNLLVERMVVPSAQAAAPTQPRQTPTDADWEWISRYRQQAFDALMPMDSPAGIIFYRSYRDLYHEVPERYFMIRTDYGELLTATVVRPVGSSIQQQLIDLHMADRNAPFESVLEQIAVSRVDVAWAEGCEAVRTSRDRLDKINVSLGGRRDIIRLHPVVHRFVVHSPDGQFDVRLTEPDVPLVRWAAQTIDALLACAQRGSGPRR